MSARLGVKPHILRYWEEQFPMLRPLKRAGGRRHYRPEDVALVEEINDLLGKQGYTIKGARNFLLAKEKNVTPRTEMTQSAVAGDDDRAMLDAVRAIRDRLANSLDMM